MEQTFPQRVLACRRGGMGQMPDVLDITDLSKSFSETRALDGISLTLSGGAIGAVLGPSGSGKTTLLRLIAGFDRPDAGQIMVGERVVAGPNHFVAPEDRRVAMVFQDYALFPHMSVRDNIGYPLGRRPDRKQVDRMLALVGLKDLAERRPDQLSGGQQQRVALGRALVGNPDLILLDEPFSGLEFNLRQTMRDELLRIIRASGVSALIVTHDCDEALSLAEVIFLLHEGRLVQSGSPEQVYQQPVNLWAAQFLGPVNRLVGEAKNGRIYSSLGVVANPCAIQGKVSFSVRPEAIKLDGDGEAIIIGRRYYGHDQMLTVELTDGQRIEARQLGAVHYRIGDRVQASIDGPIALVTGQGS